VPLEDIKVGERCVVSVTRLLRPSFFSGTTNAEIYSEKIITLHFQNLGDEENKYGFFQQDNVPSSDSLA
jgi:hypothetical protein